MVFYFKFYKKLYCLQKRAKPYVEAQAAGLRSYNGTLPITIGTLFQKLLRMFLNAFAFAGYPPADVPYARTVVKNDCQVKFPKFFKRFYLILPHYFKAVLACCLYFAVLLSLITPFQLSPKAKSYLLPSEST